jgi:alpha,alpha-trehalose phosphorylase
MAMAYGFAGMRDYDGQLTFRPRLPGHTHHLKFRLVVRGQRLEVDINRDETTYTLLEGTRLTLRHEKEDIELTREVPKKICACRPAAGGKVGESD